MAGEPIWYELMTPDPAAAAAFYKAVLGWDIPAEGVQLPNGSEYRMIGRTDDGNAGGVLTLSKAMREAGARPHWFVYFNVGDIEAAVARASALGAKVWMGIQDVPGAGRMAMLADPQGAPFYAMAPTPPPGQPDAKSDLFDPKEPERCAWNELNTSDAPAALEFYGELFGWTFEHGMDGMPDDNIYRFIDAGGTTIGAISSMMAPGYSPSFLPYFRVRDIEAAKAAVQANGGTVAMGPHEVPGGDWIVVARDPTDAWVGFVGSKGE